MSIGDLSPQSDAVLDTSAGGPSHLVSVIVPIFDVEQYLERCVDSILAQSYAHLELILVDDGSPDRCGEICDNYAASDPRVRVIHQTNAGVSAARNIGLDAAVGDLLMFVDGDDWVDPDIIAHLVDALEGAHADISACVLRRSISLPQPKAEVTHVRVLDTLEALALYASPLANAMTSPCGKVYRRALFDGIRFPVGRLYEDEYVTYRVVGRARRIALSSAELYHYFVRAGSTTQRTQDAAQVLDRARALTERGEYFGSLGLDEAAAVSYWKALLLTRLATRLEQDCERSGAAPDHRAELRSLAKHVVRADLHLRHRVFAGGYAVAPRAIDLSLSVVRKAGSVSSGVTRRIQSIGGPPGKSHRHGGGSHEAMGGEGRRLEVVVVAYKGPEMLRQALEPVGSLPVTVVDNSSMVEIEEICCALGCRYIDAGRNGGFASGVNIGLTNRQWPDSDVLLLNPDAVISRDDVGRLHRALLADPELASVGPAQVDALGRTSRVAWPFPSPAGTWAEALGLHRFRQKAPTYVIGSILLLRAEAIDEVGPFDEQFFLYSEEADWAYRAHRRGWRHTVVPDVRAIHVGGATSSDEARRIAHFHGSQERYLRKHYGAAGWQAARWGQILGDSLRATLKAEPVRGRLKERIALYRRGPVMVEADHVARSAPLRTSEIATNNGGQH